MMGAVPHSPSDTSCRTCVTVATKKLGSRLLFPTVDKHAIKRMWPSVAVSHQWSTESYLILPSLTVQKIVHVFTTYRDWQTRMVIDREFSRGKSFKHFKTFVRDSKIGMVGHWHASLQMGVRWWSKGRVVLLNTSYHGGYHLWGE